MADQEISTILTTENITQASQAIQKYIIDCVTVLKKVQSEIETLRGSGFVGDASDGFNTYITTTITNLNKSFYEGEEALMPSLKKWLDSYVIKLLAELDPNLKSQNENIYNEGN